MYKAVVVPGTLLSSVFLWTAVSLQAIADESAPPRAEIESFEAAPVSGELSRVVEDDWFWFDPFPGPGQMSSAGADWGFVRLAAYRPTQDLVGMTDIQRLAAVEIYRMYATKQPASPVQRAAHRTEARQTITPLLSEGQTKRLDGIALQRMTFRAFTELRVEKALALSDEQQRRIRRAIVDHSLRLRDYQTLPAKERILLGQHSHKKVWLDIRQTLTPDQVKTFNQLRGPRPDSGSR